MNIKNLRIFLIIVSARNELIFLLKVVNSLIFKQNQLLRFV